MIDLEKEARESGVCGEMSVKIAEAVAEAMELGATPMDVVGHIEMYLYSFKSGVFAEACDKYILMQLESEMSTKQ